MFSISEVSRRIGVKRHRITYAHQQGYLPEVARFQGARLYTEDDVRVEAYFRARAAEGERTEDEPG